jgi:hypothetical protein
MVTSHQRIPQVLRCPRDDEAEQGAVVEFEGRSEPSLCEIENRRFGIVTVREVEDLDRRRERRIHPLTWLLRVDAQTQRVVMSHDDRDRLLEQGRIERRRDARQATDLIAQ